jgi:dienelactone hydrolase
MPGSGREPNGSLPGVRVSRRVEKMRALSAPLPILWVFLFGPTCLLAQERQPEFFEQEVAFPVREFQLAGTLTLPSSPGPHPAVILIPPATGMDRDRCSGDYCPFRDLAHGLATRGIAALRYDERGSGSSAGDHVWQYPIQDLRLDILSAFDLLSDRAEIDPGRIGLIGYSVGAGVVLPLAAAEITGVSSVVSLSGEAFPYTEMRTGYLRFLGTSSGKSEEAIAQAIRFEEEVVHPGAREGGDWGEIAEQLRAMAFSQGWDEMTISVGPTAFFRTVLDLDPRTLWQAVRCPALFVFGGADSLVQAEPNRRALVETLERGGNRQHDTRTIENMGHDLRNAEVSRETIAPDLMEAVSEWLVSQFRVREGGQ